MYTNAEVKFGQYCAAPLHRGDPAKHIVNVVSMKRLILTSWICVCPTYWSLYSKIWQFFQMHSVYLKFKFLCSVFHRCLTILKGFCGMWPCWHGFNMVSISLEPMEQYFPNFFEPGTLSKKHTVNGSLQLKFTHFILTLCIVR